MMKVDNSVYEFKEADVVFLGFPRTRSKTPNPLYKGAPDLLRFAINSKDDYNPENGSNPFDTLKICDMGNIDRFELNSDYKNQTLFILGGEHSITNDITNELMYKRKDFHIIVFDAHLDMREQGEENATFLRKVVERTPKERIHLVGQRIFSKEEHAFMKEKGLSIESDIDLKGKDVYISFDIDVIDDAYVPTCSTPEPFGRCLNYYNSLLRKIARNNRIIGIDFVEFSGKAYDITYSNIAHLIINLLKEISSK